MNRTARLTAAKALLSLAREVTAADEEEPVDEAFVSRVRNLKTKLTKLGQKKKRKLNQFGIGMIRPNATVEDLIGALEQVLADA